MCITFLPLQLPIKPENKYTTKNIKKTNLKHISTPQHSTYAQNHRQRSNRSCYPPKVMQSNVFLSRVQACQQSGATIDALPNTD
jgi:hypothetical protein